MIKPIATRTTRQNADGQMRNEGDEGTLSATHRGPCNWKNLPIMQNFPTELSQRDARKPSELSALPEAAKKWGRMALEREAHQTWREKLSFYIPASPELLVHLSWAFCSTPLRVQTSQFDRKQPLSEHSVRHKLQSWTITSLNGDSVAPT